MKNKTTFFLAWIILASAGTFVVFGAVSLVRLFLDLAAWHWQFAVLLLISIAAAAGAAWVVRN